jgi:hypothetical protein
MPQIYGVNGGRGFRVLFDYKAPDDHRIELENWVGTNLRQ